MTNGWQNYDTEWAATVPNFDYDNAFGAQGETTQSNLWRYIREQPHKVEVKHERRTNGYHFIEVQHRPPGHSEYKPSDSGLLLTSAQIWVCVVDDVALHAWPVELLRSAHRAAELGPLRDGGLSGDNPTLGYVVSVAKLDVMAGRARRRNA